MLKKTTNTIAVLNEDELKKIQDLNGLKFALQDLCKLLSDDSVFNKQESEIYERLVADYKKCLEDMELFWDECTKTYNINMEQGDYLTVNFYTSELYLENDE